MVVFVVNLGIIGVDVGRLKTRIKQMILHNVFVEINGKVIAHQVKTGIQSNDLIEIIEGLKINDVVVSGSYRAISRDLSNGEAVTSKKKDMDEKQTSGDK